MLLSLFGTRHGKGECDSLSVVVKRAIWVEQLNDHGH